MVFARLSLRKVLLASVITVSIIVLIVILSRRKSARYFIYPEKSVGVFEEHQFSNKLENLPEFEFKASPGNYFLVVLLISRPSATERRNSIRASWINGNKKLLQSQKVVARFSIGLKGASTEVVNELKREQSIYKDLLFLDDFEESYSNLTLKVLKSFVLIQRHYNFSYLLKCDDDTFVLLDIIVRELEKRNSEENYYWGHMIEEAQVFTEGKFAEIEWNLGRTYIPYAIGAGYILSGTLIEHIARNSGNLMLYHNEDVSVSVWITPYNVERQHDSRVCENKRYMFSDCKKSAVIIHPIQSSQDMLSLQQIYDKLFV